jgi:predicted ATPase/class 3 adenylate cyclase
MFACSACGKENPDGAAFCLACGSALPPDEAGEGTRRTVTVVFADVTGSTTLGEQLDPEALRRVMARYYTQARAALERHGGTVEKFIGDAVVAVFGVPRRHEDDAVRAVRAAVEVRAEVRALSAELETSVGKRLEIRTGVNTGEVVAGSLAEGASFASGDAMNVAARLEQAAAPDEILVGESTYRLVRDAVSAESVAPLSLKGKAEPVAAWRVLSVDPHSAGLARRLDAPLVGRRQELATLLDTFVRARDKRHCELVTVLGAAGSGKSRLVRELIASVEAQATVLRGRCLPYGEGITFWPIMEMIRDAAGVGDDDLPDAVRDKIEALVGRGEGQESIAAGLASLLGLEGQGASAIQETFLALRGLFETLAAERPLVLVVDDIHWAEPTLLDFLEYLAGWARAAPVLLVCISRPELVEARPGWTTPSENASVLMLQPLSAADSEELARELLAGAAGRGLTERITSAAEGNPLYVEEFVRMLRDDHLLDAHNGDGAAQLAELVLPPTIEALLSARLDRLEPEERGVVERGAVVGKVFWWGAIAELSPQREEGLVGSCLQALVRREFVVPESSTFAGEDAFRFSHILMRDAAYGSIAKSARARFHAAFATWLERKAGARLAEYEEIVGYHFEQACRYEREVGVDAARTAELAESASARLASAGRRAAQRADMRAAALLLERAAELAPETDVARIEILLDLSDCLIEGAEFARAESVLREARQGAESMGSARLQARAALLGSVLQSFVHPAAWRESVGREVEAAKGILEEAGDDVGLAQAHWLVGSTHWRDMRAAPTEVALEQALLHARKAGQEREQARILVLAANAAFLGPLVVDAAIARCEELNGHARGNPLAGAAILLATGALRAMKGQAAEGRADAERAKQKIHDLDLPLALGEAAQLSGIIETIIGDFARAESELRFSCELLQRMGERSLLSTSAGLLAAALCGQGRYEEALEQTCVAEQNGDEDDLATQELWRVARARCLARRGEFQRAEELAQEGVGLLAESDFLSMRGDGLVGLADVLTVIGKKSAARVAMASAIRLYESKGNVVSAQRTRMLLANLV